MNPASSNYTFIIYRISILTLITLRSVKLYHIVISSSVILIMQGLFLNDFKS